MGQPTKTYINGLFVKRVWRDSNDFENELFSLGVKKQQLIEELEKLQENKDGFINLSMGRSKKDGDPNKFSVWENDYTPTQRGSTTQNKPRPSSSKPTSNQQASVDSGSDDLPF
jgi:hypothetical protein